MPLFEYICKKCGHHFEALVFGSKQPACPQCHCSDLEQAVSTFAVSHSAKGVSSSRSSMSCGISSGGSTG
jgi:putative FmdB family regulatory protein